MAIIEIPKESSPEVNVPIVVVSTALPGASPEDVEMLVTNVLEEPLKNSLSEVRNITSVSGQGVSSITVEFEASANLADSVQDVRDEVDIAKTDLPDDATDPRIIEIDFGGEPVLTATLSAPVPQEVLYQIGEDTADALEGVRGVSSVSVGGVEDRQVNLVIDRAALTQLGLTITDVTRAIAGANVAVPVGNLEIDGAEFPVRLAGDIRTTEEIANIPILAIGGAPVYVRDIARIDDSRAEPRTLSRTSVNNEPSLDAISFNVFKSENANITQVSTDARAQLEVLQQEGGLLDGITVQIVFDNGELLLDDLTTLTRSGMQTMLLVSLILALAVGWREALIAAVSIPLSFLTAFIGLEATGNTLNFISLFALILSIGVIVDSTIVIVEGINRRLKELEAHTEDETEFERQQIKSRAALDVVREFHWPLTAGTLTTVAVFAPLLIVSGIVGEYIKGIPYTVIFVLLASLLMALGFVPMLASKLLRRGGAAIGNFGRRRDAFIAQFERWYRGRLLAFLNTREAQNTFFATLGVLFVIAMALPSLNAVQVVFFEDSDSDYIFVDVEMPIGTTLARTDLEVRKVEELLYQVPEATSFTTTVGETSQFGNPFGGASGNARFGNIFITLDENRDRASTAVLDDIRQRASAINTATIRVNQLSGGPPSLAPITITLFGDDLTDLESAALTVESILREIPGTTDITSTAKDNTSEFVLTIDRAEVAAQGTSIITIASSLRSALFGEDVSEIKQLGDDIDIVARLSLDESGGSDTFATNQTTIDTLTQIQIPTAAGTAPLSAFVHSTVEPSRSAIRHEDGKRIATVSSRLTEGANALVVSREFQERLAQVQLPSSVTVDVGGESEDIDQSFTDMFVALILGVVGMFGILVLQFNSFRFATYVLSIVPLSLIGVFTGLMLTASPLSFPSIMGFIALAGIVVNNSIILVDTINKARRKNQEHKPLNEIIADASTSRLRPVLLTALTTVIGVMPLLWAAAIWVPLAYAIMFGLAFSTIITLVLVPSIYARWPGKLEPATAARNDEHDRDDIV